MLHIILFIEIPNGVIALLTVALGGTLAALITALFGLKGKRLDNEGKFRDELAKELAVVREMVEEIANDRDIWRDKYWTAKDTILDLTDKLRNAEHEHKISKSECEAICRKMTEARQHLEKGNYQHVLDLIDSIKKAGE